MSAIVEFFGYHVRDKKVDWEKVVKSQVSRYTGKKSVKVRKSQPHIAIGTVVITYGKERRNLIIDPERFLENGQVFSDCLHLLTDHEPGNELHLIPEFRIPGGNIDYILASVKEGKVRDFVGIELQAVDTTGSLWGEREKLLVELGLKPRTTKIPESRFGINWKMTAKTTLVQMHHKIGSFEHINKHLVLVIQDHLLEYMRKEFDFSRFNRPPRPADSVHIHSYKLTEESSRTSLELDSRISTDIVGLATGLGLRADSHVDLRIITGKLESKISSDTAFNIVKRI